MTLYTYMWANWLPSATSHGAWRWESHGGRDCVRSARLVGIPQQQRMLMEDCTRRKEIIGKWENAICIVAGFVAGLLLGFNGYMWSQSVIVEVYSFSVLCR